MDKTSIFDVNELRQEIILDDLNDVVDNLDEKNYNSTNQLVGYILTGDKSYISSYKDSRKILGKYDRSELLMAIINGYMDKL